MVLGELRRRGIEPMLLKGAALTLLHYRDSGLRPMEDVDILVSNGPDLRGKAKPTAAPIVAAAALSAGGTPIPATPPSLEGDPVAVPAAPAPDAAAEAAPSGWGDATN